MDDSKGRNEEEQGLASLHLTGGHRRKNRGWDVNQGDIVSSMTNPVNRDEEVGLLIEELKREMKG